MEHYYSVTGPDSATIHKAFFYCLLSATKQSVKEFTIAVATKDQLTANTMIEALGLSFCKEIAKNQMVNIQGITVKLMTKKIAPKAPGRLVLAIHPSTEYLKDILTSNNFNDSVYIPWTPDELKIYLTEHASAVQLL